MQQHVLHASVPIGRGGFADDPVAIVDMTEDKFAVFIARRHFGDDVGCGVNQAELHARKRSAGCIHLLIRKAHRRIGHGFQRLIRVDKRTVHRQTDMHGGFEIAGERLGFLDGISSIRDFLKRHQPVCVRNGGRQAHTCFRNQRKFHAGKRHAVFVLLAELYAGIVVAQHRVARDISLLVHREARFGFIERIAARRKDFAEGVCSRRNGDIRDFAVRVGRGAVNHFALLVSDLDLCARNGFRAGDIGFGQRHGRINQLVIEGLRQLDADYRVATRLKRNRETVWIELPACLGLQLAHIVVAMRKCAVKRQPAVFIGRADSHKRICQQGHAVFMDIPLAEQPEHKAFARLAVQRPQHFTVCFRRANDFGFFVQRNSGGKIGIADLHADLHQRGLIIRIRQLDFARRIIRRVSFRRFDLGQRISAQRQKFGRILAARRRDDRIDQLTLGVPRRSVPADDLLSGTQFKDRTCQIPLFIDRLLHRIAVCVHGFKADEHIAALFHENLPLDRLILHFDVQFIRLPGFVAVMPDHHGQRLRPNQVSFRRGNLLDVVQAPPERFRQGHAARFIRGECVDLLFGRIMHRLAHRFAVCVLELKRRMRQRDGLARFAIRLEDTQAVENRTVAECQRRRVLDILCPVDFKLNRAFDFIALFALRLLQHIDAVGQCLGLGVSALIRHQMIALKRTRVFIAARTFEIHVELCARFRLLNAIRGRVVVVVS